MAAQNENEPEKVTITKEEYQILLRKARVYDLSQVIRQANYEIVNLSAEITSKEAKDAGQTG